MWDFFEKELQQRLHELDGDATLTERVRGVLLEMLPAGESTIEFAAQRPPSVSAPATTPEWRRN